MTRHIVIVGGGIIGSTTAYYSSLHKQKADTKITLLESTSIAAGASGKAGGLLALDWHGMSTAPLAELSYNLHEQLAKEHDGESRWGYRQLDTLQLSLKTTSKRTKSLPGAEWVEHVTSATKMGDKSTTSQVHPEQFTNAMAEFAQKQGVELVMGTAVGIERDPSTRKISALVYQPSGSNAGSEQETLPCTDVVLCAGPWTGVLAQKLFPDEPSLKMRSVQGVSGHRAHSVVVQASQPITAHAFFTSLRTPGGTYGPEYYCRPDNTVYVCGAAAHESAPLSKVPTAADVKLHREALDELREHATSLSSTHLGKDAKLLKEQACYLPTAPSGDPIIGRVLEGVYVAAGHTCWGICNSAGTGKVMSEILFDGMAISADVGDLAPI